MFNCPLCNAIRKMSWIEPRVDDVRVDCNMFVCGTKTRQVEGNKLEFTSKCNEDPFV